MIDLPSAGPRPDPDDDQAGALRREVHHVDVGTVGHLDRDPSPAFGRRLRQARGEIAGTRVVLTPGERAGAEERRRVRP